MYDVYLEIRFAKKYEGIVKDVEIRRRIHWTRHAVLP